MARALGPALRCRPGLLARRAGGIAELTRLPGGSAAQTRCRQALQAFHEHHGGEAIRDDLPVPERAPHGALRAGRLYVDVRVLLPVPLGRLDVREIEDIGDAAQFYNEVKALATGNLLLMDKAEADADLTCLERAERAYHRNQDALCHKVTQADQRIATLTALIGDIDSAISRRADTRGDAFTMTMDGIRYTKRTDAGRRLQQLAVQMEGALLNSSHRRLEKRSGELGGFSVTVTVERVLGSMNVIMVLDGAPGTEVRMTSAEIKVTDPGKLIIRLENRLSGLESLRSRSLSEIDQLTTEAAHARDDIARPFPQTDQLAASRDRVLRLEEKLRETAAPSRGDGNDWLLPAAMHDAAVMAGISGAAVVVASHQDGQPQSPA